MNGVLQDLLRHQEARAVLRDRSRTLEEHDAARAVLGLTPAEHGTRSRYVQGCRCKPCRRANTRYSRDHRRGVPDVGPDDLPVNCWCEAQVVGVPARLVGQGVTFSCGRQGCSG